MAKSLPKYLCGGVSAGEWPKMSPKSFARALYLSRCNNIVLEAMAPAYDPNGYNNKTVPEVYAAFKKFVNPILDLDLWVTIHLANGGDEMITHFGAENIANNFVAPLIKDYGVNSRIIICPIAESHGEPNENFLVQYCMNNWGAKGGYLIYNGDGRPHNLPPGYTLLDYHTQDANDHGPQIGKMSLVDTDNGPIIGYLRYGAPAGKYWNPDRVASFSTENKIVGNGTSLYAFQTTSNNGYAMDIIGNIYNVRKKPNFFDKLIMEIKLMKY